MKYDELISKLCERAPWCPDTEAKLMAEAANAIADLISALKASNDVIVKNKPKWIPVSERLPKLGEMVAVYMHSAIHGDEVKIDRMVISNTTDIPYWSFYKGRVKAWMPLPEPPKEES